MFQEKVSKNLKENLLAEYQQQNQSKVSVIDQALARNPRLQECQKKEQINRYNEIFDLHTAAINVSNANYRSFNDD